MTTWSKNNAAQTYAYLALRVLDMTKESFAKAEKLKMNQLGHWVPGSSRAIRKEVARARGSMMDNLFTITFEATYEEGFGKTKAVSAIADILENSSKTVKALASVADDCYDFLGEELDV